MIAERPDVTPAPVTAHEHHWQAHGLVTDREVSRSPVSRMDDSYRELQFAIQSCACGEVRRTLVARGDALGMVETARAELREADEWAAEEAAAARTPMAFPWAGEESAA